MITVIELIGGGYVLETDLSDLYIDGQFVTIPYKTKINLPCLPFKIETETSSKSLSHYENTTDCTNTVSVADYNADKERYLSKALNYPVPSSEDPEFSDIEEKISWIRFCASWKPIFSTKTTRVNQPFTVFKQQASPSKYIELDYSLPGVTLANTTAKYLQKDYCQNLIEEKFNAIGFSHVDSTYKDPAKKQYKRYYLSNKISVYISEPKYHFEIPFLYEYRQGEVKDLVEMMERDKKTIEQHFNIIKSAEISLKELNVIDFINKLNDIYSITLKVDAKIKSEKELDRANTMMSKLIETLKEIKHDDSKTIDIETI